MAAKMASGLVRNMATMAAAPTTQAAKSDSISFLPLRLRNFFAKYPPQHYSAAVAPASRLRAPIDANTTTSSSSETSTSTSTDTTSLSPDNLPSPYTPSRDVGATIRNPTVWTASKAILHNDPEFPNPFLPQQTATNKWRSPKYGLRQQADLVKLAKKFGVEQLLPTGRKSSLFKETRLAERGLAIKGTGIGQKVKGHKWERTMETRLEDRKKAMLEMPEMIRQWKQRGHGRGWKKWPRR